ncbi:MAG TPA: hypothetical protein VFV70_07240 [Hyphomonadaceae bacterium]|nr:hypothetical protein [Hyphomonadaceae bacterium]
MSHRCFALLACVLFSPTAFAQAPTGWAPPRTAEGRPDFQGVWASMSLTMVERPKDVTELSPTEEQASALVEKFWSDAPALDDPDIAFYNVRNFSVVKGAIRTSHLVAPADGRLPYTPAGLALAEREPTSAMALYDDPEQRPTYERCLAGFAQAPMRTIPLLIPMQVVQTPGALVFWMEDVAGFRTIHLDRAPPPGVMQSHEGWSSGRWEDDTLVIETTHLRPGDHWRTDYGRAVVVDETSRIVEKLTLISEDELLYQFTVEDPDLYTGPWLAEFSFRRQRTPVYEYACHEGNYSIVNALLGGRVADAKPKPAAKK